MRTKHENANTVRYKELLGVDIISLLISTPGRGYPPPGVDIISFFREIMSMPGRGYPPPGMDIISFLGEIMSTAWISMPGGGYPRPEVLYNRL